jgi:hypothetical protein
MPKVLVRAGLKSPNVHEASHLLPPLGYLSAASRESSSPTLGLVCAFRLHHTEFGASPTNPKDAKDQRMLGSNSRGANLAKADTGMTAKTRRKRKRPKKVDGTSPSLSKRPKGPWCMAFGCTKWAQQGGVCCTHGGKKIRAKCSYVDDKEGRCQNVFKRGGLCRVSATSRLSHFCVFCSLTFFITTEARSIQARNLRLCWMQQGSQAARTTFL